MAAPWIMDDELWAVVEPLLLVKPAGTPGPAQLDSRRALQGILFVLITGIGWEDLPQDLGFGSGMTCWRKLRDWQAAEATRRRERPSYAEPLGLRLPRGQLPTDGADESDDLGSGSGVLSVRGATIAV